VKIKIKAILFLLVWILIAANPSIAMDQSSKTGKLKILFHVKTSLDEDDAQICVVPNVAWAAIHKGHDVTLLFDGSAVTSVKKGGFFDQTKTDMDRAKLPERERVALSQQFNYSLEQIPHNYGEYLHFLKNLGARIYINKTMMLLYQIEPDQIDSSLELIELNEMLDIMTSSDFYFAY